MPECWSRKLNPLCVYAAPRNKYKRPKKKKKLRENELEAPHEGKT